MHSNCILDSVANLFVRHILFVGHAQKSPITSHLKGLDPSLSFCLKLRKHIVELDLIDIKGSNLQMKWRVD